MTKTLEKYPAWSLSVGLHFLILTFVIFLQWRPAVQVRRINFEVIENPKLAPAALNINPPKPEEKIKPKIQPEQRQVFGASRKSIAAAAQADAVSIKQGNTIAKAADDLHLRDSDADSLPLPADDYLVSAMPVLTSEVRIPYPEEARRANIEGPVIMDLLIDNQGEVRQVTLVQGPGFGLNEAATQALRNFKFSPARIDQQAVAVRIRYTYRFVLENR